MSTSLTRYGVPGLTPSGCLLDAENEVRAGENRFKRAAHAAFESALRRALIVELQERVHFAGIHRPTVGRRRQTRDDSRGAGPLFRGGRRPALKILRRLAVSDTPVARYGRG
jgi:hypothetical protein